MLQVLLPLLGTIFDKVIPDPQAAADAKLRAMELAQRGELAVLDAEAKLAAGQLEINKADAQSQDWVQRRWRPLAGWVCVLGLAYSFLFQPLFPWVVKVVLLATGSTVVIPELPPIDIEYLLGLLSALLGLGGFRTFERVRGKA
jgi:Holin of 3TMs, for gene-transfer release